MVSPCQLGQACLWGKNLFALKFYHINILCVYVVQKYIFFNFDAELYQFEFPGFLVVARKWKTSTFLRRTYFKLEVQHHLRIMQTLLQSDPSFSPCKQQLIRGNCKRLEYNHSHFQINLLVGNSNLSIICEEHYFKEFLATDQIILVCFCWVRIVIMSWQKKAFHLFLISVKYECVRLTPANNFKCACVHKHFNM